MSYLLCLPRELVLLGALLLLITVVIETTSAKIWAQPISEGPGAPLAVQETEVELHLRMPCTENVEDPGQKYKALLWFSPASSSCIAVMLLLHNGFGTAAEPVGKQKGNIKNSVLILTWFTLFFHWHHWISVNCAPQVSPVLILLHTALGDLPCSHTSIPMFLLISFAT